MGAGKGEPLRSAVDFRAARRQLEGLSDVSPSVRQRALAAYVGLFDYADEDGLLEISSRQIAEDFDISKVSWLRYRAALEAAGLLVVVEESRGGNVNVLRLKGALLPEP